MEAVKGIRGRETPVPLTPNADAARLKALEARLDALEAKARQADERH